MIFILLRTNNIKIIFNSKVEIFNYLLVTTQKYVTVFGLPEILQAKILHQFHHTIGLNLMQTPTGTYYIYIYIYIYIYNATHFLS